MLVDKLYLLIYNSSLSSLYTLTEVYKLYLYSLYTIPLSFYELDYAHVCPTHGCIVSAYLCEGIEASVRGFI